MTEQVANERIYKAAEQGGCRYCGRLVDSDGGINHVGGCAGLEKIDLNRLQYDALVTRGAPETTTPQSPIEPQSVAPYAGTEDEPVAWMAEDGRCMNATTKHSFSALATAGFTMPLYRRVERAPAAETPEQRLLRKWLGGHAPVDETVALLQGPAAKAPAAETKAEPVAWRRLINSPYERHPRYGYSEERFEGGEPLYTRLVPETAAETKAQLPEGHWWCPHCRYPVPGLDVTYDETHDVRAGGCGYNVVPERPPEKAPAAECSGCAKLEKEIEKELESRDRNADYADQLANMIGVLLRQDMGEHTSENDPWENAIEALRVEIGTRQSAPGELRAEHEEAACEHLRSELLAEKRVAGEPLFQMRKCLDCEKIFRARSSLKTPPTHRDDSDDETDHAGSDTP